MSRYSSPFAESDFDKRFRRTQLFMRVWFVFVLSMVLLIFGLIGYAGYRVATEPEVIGEFVGKMVSGYESEVN